MSTQQERLLFLDAIRTFVVLCVVILHAACAYAEIIPWWPVQEFPKPPLYTLIILFFDLFCMPTLFFIAGYFVPNSLGSRGIVGFMKAKLLRLGVPFALLGLFYVPVVTYISYVRRTPAHDGFFDFWLFQLSTAWKPSFLLIDSAEAAAPHINDFSQWHLWFISLLLVFFAIAALMSRSTPSLFQRDTATKTDGKTILLHMTIAGLVSTLLVTLVNMVIPSWSWATIGGYFMFQPTRLGMYLTFFALGFFAHKKHWFATATIPGSLWFWLVAGLVLDIAFIALSKSIMLNTSGAPIWLALSHGLIRSFTGLAWLAFLIKASARWFNTPRPILTSMNRSSYDIYLLHLPIIVGLQLAAVSLSTGLFPKFLMESIIGILVCWQLSARLVRPHPKVATAVLLGTFAVACVFLH